MKSSKILLASLVGLTMCSTSCGGGTKFLIKYNNSEGGYIVGNVNQEIESEKSSQEVIAIPKDGYRFINWSDGVETASRQETNVKNNIEVTANFEKINYVSLNYSTSEGGIIDGDKTQSVEVGYDGKEVTAYAKEGYRFVNWSDGVETPSRQDKNVNDNINVKANFVKKYAVTISSNNFYASNINENLVYDVDEGKEFTFTVEPNVGYKFVNWLNGSTDKTIKVNVSNDMVLVADFEEDYLDLPVVSINTESFSPITSKEDYIKCNVSINNSGEYNLESSAKIKGRGNTTWTMPKKPYKIKFDKKVDLFGNGEAKTWTLIANYCDKSLSRNYLAQKLAASIGLDNTPSVNIVDLYVNNEYLGVYNLCEQIEVGKNRVNISEDYSSTDTGYLLELDSRAPGEGTKDIDYFVVDGKTPYGIKSPDIEKVGSEFVQYIKEYMQSAVDALKDDDFDRIKELVDIDSFARCYIIHEMFATVDVGHTSFYLYKDKGGKLMCGPVWDFDISSGNADYVPTACDTNNLYAKNANFFYNNLCRFDEFKEQVKTILNENDLKQELTDLVSLLKKDYLESFKRNFKRWNIMGHYVWPNTQEIVSITTCEGQINYLENWLNKKLNTINNEYTN